MTRSGALPLRPSTPRFTSGRPLPPHFGVHPNPPILGRRGFDWLRASLDPYGSGRNPYGPGGFITQAELGNLYGYTGPVGYGSGYGYASGGGSPAVEIEYQDVYDDDDSNMGCDPTLGTSLPTAHRTAMSRVHESAVHHPSGMYTDDESGSAIGWEGGYYGHHWPSRWDHPAPPRVRPAPPGGYYGYNRPAPPVMRDPWGLDAWEGSGFHGDGEFGLGTIIPSNVKKTPPPGGMSSTQGVSSGTSSAPSYAEAGQDASFGWMMPTLPGAISDSPLRGVFAPDAGLTGSLGRGGIS
jgi:hypothetical protein